MDQGGGAARPCAGDRSGLELAGREAKASRVLILNLSGGVRSSAAFIASAKTSLNPWGRIKDVSLPIGQLLATNPLKLRLPEREPIRVPRLREIVDRFAVVGTWDPGRGDHVRSEKVAHRGATDERSAGILVRLLGALSEASEGDGPQLPAFELGEPGSTSFAPAGRTAGATVSVERPSQLPKTERVGAAPQPAPGRDALDDRFIAGLGRAGRSVALAYARQRRLAARLSTRLVDPVVRYDGAFAPEAALGELRVEEGAVPLTNAILGQVLGENLVLAFRLLQLGSPAVSVTLPGFDLHSGEQEGAPPLYGELGRIWAGLHFLLRRVGDPVIGGATMLDRTLVVTNSEFGRDPGGSSGFNGGDGSDHGAHPATFYLGHAVMGAGVRGGRLHGPVDTNTFDARRSRERYSPSDFLATLMGALGVEGRRGRWGFAGARPITALWRGG